MYGFSVAKRVHVSQSGAERARVARMRGSRVGSGVASLGLCGGVRLLEYT